MAVFLLVGSWRHTAVGVCGFQDIGNCVIKIFVWSEILLQRCASVFSCTVPSFVSPVMSTVNNLHNLDQQADSTPKASNPVFQPRCNRTPLSQLNKSEQVWRDSRTYARSAIQALELKKQQQQENMQRSRNSPAAAAKHVIIGDDKWVKAYTKAFPTFKIYFDGIENSTRKRLEEKVKLLGSVSGIFFFFSQLYVHR